MRKSLRNDICILSFLLLISIILIIGYQFPVIDKYKEWVQFYSVINDISIGYIASFIFYILVEFIPKNKTYKDIEEYERVLCKEILDSLLFILQSVNTGIKQIDLRYKEVTKEAYTNGSKDVYFSSIMPNHLSTVTLSGSTVGEEIINQLNDINISVEKLLRYVTLTDSALIKIINKILKLDLKNYCDNLILLEKNGIIKRSSLDNINYFYDLYLFYKELQSYYWTNYRYSIDVLVDLLLSSFTNNQLNKTLKYAKKILSMDQTHPLALLYRAKAAIEYASIENEKTISNYVKSICNIDNYYRDLLEKDYGKEVIFRLLEI